MKPIDPRQARARHIILQRLRVFLNDQGFVEIHSPVLVRQLYPANGACVTIDSTNYELRQCMELRLRSALAEGLQAVYELGPCFRPADKPDGCHHPEFYMLEMFKRELDYAGLVNLTRELLGFAAPRPGIDFERINVCQWLEQGLEIEVDGGGNSIRSQLLERRLVPAEMECRPAFEAINFIINDRLERHLGTQDRPALLEEYPACTICLAQKSPGRPSTIERFEVFVEGIEIAHGFVDEMNADDVLARMRENGPQFTDENFVELLRSGKLPASAGLGIGIERLLLAYGEATSMSDLLHENQFAAQ